MNHGRINASVAGLGQISIEINTGLRSLHRTVRRGKGDSEKQGLFDISFADDSNRLFRLKVRQVNARFVQGLTIFLKVMASFTFVFVVVRIGVEMA